MHPGLAPAHSDPRHDADADGWAPRVLMALIALCVAVTFVSGGSSQQTGYGVLAGQLLALAVVLAIPLQPDWYGRLRASRWPLLVATCMFALPLLQLLPIPTALWQWPSFRADLQRDLAAAGVTAIKHRWSLAPLATERDLYLLLPAFAAFCAMQVMPRALWQWLLGWCMALVAFSVLLAFAQLPAGQDSFLNPFPQYQPALAGVFANRNHQACAMVVGLVLALMAAVQAWRQRGGVSAALLAAAACAALFALALPLVNSRAGVVIGVGAIGAVVLIANLTVARSAHEPHGRPWRLVVAALALVLLVVGAAGALTWWQHDASLGAPGTRWHMLTATAHAGLANAPLGSGFGAYVRAFEQATQGALMGTGYINNAHDEYVQWWFEAGPLAIVAMLAGLAVLVTTAHELLRLPAASRLRSTGLAAWLALCVMLLHSTVDYPLRTPVLMTLFGLLAGIAVAAAAEARKRWRNPVPAPAASAA